MTEHNAPGRGGCFPDTPANGLACEDCGDPMTGAPGMARRTRCPECGLLVCHWCWWHVHKATVVAKEAERLGL